MLLWELLVSPGCRANVTRLRVLRNLNWAAHVTERQPASGERRAVRGQWTREAHFRPRLLALNTHGKAALNASPLSCAHIQQESWEGDHYANLSCSLSSKTKGLKVIQRRIWFSKVCVGTTWKTSRFYWQFYWQTSLYLSAGQTQKNDNLKVNLEWKFSNSLIVRQYFYR